MTLTNRSSPSDADVAKRDPDIGQIIIVGSIDRHNFEARARSRGVRRLVANARQAWRDLCEREAGNGRLARHT